MPIAAYRELGMESNALWTQIRADCVRLAQSNARAVARGVRLQLHFRWFLRVVETGVEARVRRSVCWRAYVDRRESVGLFIVRIVPGNDLELRVERETHIDTVSWTAGHARGRGQRRRRVARRTRGNQTKNVALFVSFQKKENARAKRLREVSCRSRVALRQDP